MIEATNIMKSYGDRIVLNNINAKIDTGDFVAITGESGKGKTTLLNILGLLDLAQTGKIIIDGVENPTKKQIMLLQRNMFGYIFQNYALIENDTVENNLKIALAYKKNINKKETINRSLGFVGLEDLLNKKIYELSGGEQQRVAVARAHAKDASYLFADEPTGNLDKNNADIVFGFLKQLNDMGKTVIFVTHDVTYASEARNIIKL